MKYKFNAQLASADFEENTLTLQLPKDFWDKHRIRCGFVEVETEDILPVEQQFKK